MTHTSRSVQRVTGVLGDAFSRSASLIVGFALTALGVGMMITIVLLPLGIAAGILGIAVVLISLFAPNFRRAGGKSDVH